MTQSTSKPHEIVVLGGNFAGVGTAHYLLKHTIPALTALDPSRTYRVTIVSPSPQYFYKIGAPRILVQPSLLEPDAATPVMLPLASLFSAYPTDQIAFVYGAATAVDPGARTVTVTKEDRNTVPQHYDTLVVATGSTSASALWTLHGDQRATERAFADVHAALPQAKTILVAGGGPVGTESAGELAQHYPSAKITLLSGADRLLTRLSANTSAKAEKLLKAAHVEVLHDVKVVDVHPATAGGPQGEAAPKMLALSNNTTRTVDLYLDATGMRPNTAFLPKEWLTERGHVKQNPEYLRGNVESMGGRVYAVGDAGSYSHGGVIDVLFGVKPMCRSIGADLAKQLAADDSAKAVAAAKGKKALQEAKYWTLRDSQFVPVGSKTGVGQIYGWGLPSFLVVMIKSKDFMIPTVKPRAEGSDYASV